LNVWYGDTPNSFSYYEDDGTTYQYEDGKYYVRKIDFDPQGHQIVLDNAEGNYTSKFNEVHLVLHGFPQNALFTVNGKSVKTEGGEVQPFIDFSNTNGKISVKWEVN